MGGLGWRAPPGRGAAPSASGAKDSKVTSNWNGSAKGPGLFGTATLRRLMTLMRAGMAYPRSPWMKFLDIPQLALLTAYLSGRELGDTVLSAKVEAFSCACHAGGRPAPHAPVTPCHSPR